MILWKSKHHYFRLALGTCGNQRFEYHYKTWEWKVGKLITHFNGWGDTRTVRTTLTEEIIRKWR